MSSVSVNPPKTPVTKGSNGIATATIPNVCKMPGPPAPFVPAPLPNIGKSGSSPKDYSQDVTIEGKAVAIKGSTFESIGDMASKGTGGGLISANTHGITKFVGPGSMDVKIEGKNVQLLSDPMLNNCAAGGSPPNAATLLGVIQTTGLVTAVEAYKCPICEKEHSFEETPATKADASTLSSNFADRLPRSNKGKDVVTMLGVVYCKCGKKKYADQSGMTRLELCRAARDSGMKHPSNVTASYARKGGITSDPKNAVKETIAKHVGSDMRFKITWHLATVRYGASEAARGRKEDVAAAFPPGSCAAQRALVLTLERGGIPVAMTEEMYNGRQKEAFDKAAKAKGAALTQAEKRSLIPQGKQGRLIRHVVLGEDGSRETRETTFLHGQTVPPCLTCELILPLLICPKEKTTCSH